MRLRLKTTVVSLLVAAGLLALLYGVGRIVLMRDYLRLEREMMLQDGRQFEQYFERCVDEIETMCRDWSIWDDTYRFVQEPYELYVEQNLLGDALEWLGIDGIAIINLEEKSWAVSLVIARRRRRATFLPGFHRLRRTKTRRSCARANPGASRACT
jgi:sensor domain CHASE-containing protein